MLDSQTLGYIYLSHSITGKETGGDECVRYCIIAISLSRSLRSVQSVEYRYRVRLFCCVCVPSTSIYESFSRKHKRHDTRSLNPCSFHDQITRRFEYARFLYRCDAECFHYFIMLRCLTMQIRQRPPSPTPTLACSLLSPLNPACPGLGSKCATGGITGVPAMP